METRIIETPTHGRYLVRPPDAPPPWPLLIGFHGYRESAATHLTQLERIPGADRWLLGAVQGLHRFYSRGGDVVASWMTREDRESAIADNIEYVGRVLAAVEREFSIGGPLVFIGFSQGAATAFRAAANRPCQGLIAIGADVPPDVAAGTRAPLPPVLSARGRSDTLYSEAQHAADVAVLERLGVRVDRLAYDGGHEWTTDLAEAAGRFLAAVVTRT